MRHSSTNFLTQLEVPYGTSIRLDCPECGGDNTLSVTNEFGQLRYNCFRASCDFYGNLKGEIHVEEIERILGECGREPLHHSRLHPWSAPVHFVLGHGSSDCLRYLQAFNSLEPYKDGRIDVRYDPKQNRCVFLVKDKNDVVGAIGRALNGRTKPKWFIYHSTHQAPFICLRQSEVRNSKAVLVEDACSACSVSRVCDGIGLLGTILHEAYVPYLVHYDVLYVALDKDASDKAIDIQKYLSFYCKDVRVALLEKDLKYFNDEELKEWHARLTT